MPLLSFAAIILFFIRCNRVTEQREKKWWIIEGRQGVHGRRLSLCTVSVFYLQPIYHVGFVTAEAQSEPLLMHTSLAPVLPRFTPPGLSCLPSSTLCSPTFLQLLHVTFYFLHRLPPSSPTLRLCQRRKQNHLFIQLFYPLLTRVLQPACPGKHYSNVTNSMKLKDKYSSSVFLVKDKPVRLKECSIMHETHTAHYVYNGSVVQIDGIKRREAS